MSYCWIKLIEVDPSLQEKSEKIENVPFSCMLKKRAPSRNKRACKKKNKNIQLFEKHAFGCIKGTKAVPSLQKLRKSEVYPSFYGTGLLEPPWETTVPRWETPVPHHQNMDLETYDIAYVILLDQAHRGGSIVSRKK